ncbi:hypothetical protein [Streptomyces sp. NPDC101150]|uniref:hypothetical protein n=1 Tax=Streptomyces sp. NPDC101150 TaxID=3366114 RepID=UPI003802CCE0
MDTETVGRDYFVTTERETAEENAVLFVNAFRRLGIDFADIEIENPCTGCPRKGHRIALGRISVEEAGDFGAKLETALDELNELRTRRKAPANT